MDKNTVNVFYGDKCIMQYDFSDFTKNMSEDELDTFFDRFNEFWDYMRDLAYEKSGLEAKIENEIAKKVSELWKGNENLYELEQRKRKEYTDPVDDLAGLFAKNETIYNALKDEMTPEQFSVWEKLHREEVKISNKAENSVDFNSFFEFRKGNYKDDTPILGL